jgi:phosphoribosylglycinamide formyltransferase-1
MWENKGPMPFVILASGAGTNARALLQRAKEKPDLLYAAAVVSDRPNVPVLEVAKEFQVPSFVIAHEEENVLLDLLAEKGCHWACLAGYKRIVGAAFLDFFSVGGGKFARVMNVHPSLLPAYPGLHAYQRAYRDGVKLSGVTIHLVDAGLDTGAPILQEAFAREENDTLADFEQKGRALEQKLFPQALELAANNQIRKLERFGSPFVSLEDET